MLVHRIDFKVKGVTFKNEDGKDIQKEIKRILKEYKSNNYFDALYGGYTNSEIKEMDLNVSEYEGEIFSVKLVRDKYNNEECLKVYFKTYNDEYVHVGYAPKNKLEEISEWLNKKDLKVDAKLEVVGGKYKHTEFYEEDYEEKERVVIEELTYGLEVALVFSDNQINQENKREKIEDDASYINNEEEERKKQKANARIGLIVYPLVFISSFYMMPFGIIFTLISIIGFIVCLATAF